MKKTLIVFSILFLLVSCSRGPNNTAFVCVDVNDNLSQFEIPISPNKLDKKMIMLFFYHPYLKIDSFNNWVSDGLSQYTSDDWYHPSNKYPVEQISNYTVYHYDINEDINDFFPTFKEYVFQDGSKMKLSSQDYRTEIFNNDSQELYIYEYYHYRPLKPKYLEEGVDNHNRKIDLKFKKFFKCREDKKLFKKIYG